MNQRISLPIILITILSVASACNLPGSPARTTPDLPVIVHQTQTAIALAQLLTPTAPVTTAVPVGQVEPGTPVPTIGGTPETTPLAPTPNTSCMLRAKFIAETIPDNTAFAPGQAFIKTWTLQNVGTCTWTPEFSLVFLRGEQMGGTSPSPIGQTVAPDATIQLFLPQTAPAIPGEHQGFWMLRDLSERQFGLGEDGATPFWIKINVTPGLPTSTPPIPVSDSGANLGSPTIAWNFDDNRSPFFLGEGDDTDFSVRDGRLILTAIEPAGDLWRVAERSSISNFAIESQYRTGPACSGRDTYGLLVRAPSQQNNIIDSGYVFGFNCDGQYRVYRMDNGAYTGIQTWTTHSALRAGPNQNNVMMVQAIGDHLQFYGNGVLLFDFFDQYYSSGLWGMMVGTSNTNGFQVFVDTISLWNLP